MPLEPHRGMDHSLYRYSAMPARPQWRWPGDRPLAAWVVVYLEYWELDPPRGTHRNPGAHGMWGSQFPDLRTWSYRLYGERIGIWRILDVLERRGVRATVAAGAEICRRYPDLITECARRGHEIAAHGTHATRMITSRMSEAEERAHIDTAIEAVAQTTGTRPRGWFSQDQGESPETPERVAAAGFDYLADWPNDDQPYWFTTRTPLVSLPLSTELDDLQLLWMRQQPTWRYPALVEAAAARLSLEAAAGARTLALGVRSWLFGRPHRIRYLDEALAALAARTDTWQATAAEVTAAFRDCVAPETV